MSDQIGVRDAVRQLARALGALVRAVFGAVRPVRPAPSRPAAPSGPPQEWLDLVAETDPDWLARSRWADRVSPPAATGRRRQREVRVEPTHAPSPDATSPEPDPSEPRPTAYPSPVERDPGRRPAAGRYRQVEVEAGLEPGKKPSLTVPEALSDRRPPAMPEPTRPATTVRSRLVRAETPDEVAEPEPYDSPREARPDARRAEESPAEVPRSRAPEAPAPLPARVHELGTWTPRLQGEVSRRVDPPPAAMPTWPELPATDLLDDATAASAPGLVPRLWEADGAADALTTAQRRS